MKALKIVLLLALVAGAAWYFYFKDHPLAWMQGPELAATSANGRSASAQNRVKDFKEIDARLQGAMDRIPASLYDARQMPSSALDIRAQIAPFLQLHPEYVTLTQVCDVIIDADQAFAEHQEKCGIAPATTGAGGQVRPRPAGTPNAALCQQVQPVWENQRRQADAKVRQLLATLDNRRL